MKALSKKYDVIMDPNSNIETIIKNKALKEETIL